MCYRIYRSRRSVHNALMGLEGGVSYDVTGISPQSRTVAQLLKGFVSKGTLYPPLKPILCEPTIHRNGISIYAVWGLTINSNGENLDGFLMGRSVLRVCMRFRCRMVLLWGWGVSVLP